MANTIQAVVYTDDKGNDWVVGMDSEVFAQQNTAATGPKVGGADYTGTPELRGLPSSVRPRRAALKNSATGKWRYVTLLEATAALATGADTTLSIEDSDGAAATYTVQRIDGERWGRLRSAS